MANSKYEYVKSAEPEDKVIFPNMILVWISARKVQKPYDVNALKLMNSCAVAVLEKYADVVLAYGFSDEYTFVFKKTTKFYDRRASKVISIITSFFSSVFVRKWSEFFPQEELQSPPSFEGRVIPCASIETLQLYLFWRQDICHRNNLYDQCFWRLVGSGMDEREAQDFINGFKKSDLNKLLFDEFNVNYKRLDPIFRQGSCVLRTMVEDVVKYTENGAPIKRQRRKVITVHSKKIASRGFWDQQAILLKELGRFVEEINNVGQEYVWSFEYDGNKMTQFNWIVVRIDGCKFQKFSKKHKFEKPNDVRALNLMNSCAVAVLEEFRQDIVFAYGASDEYSFILKKSTNLYQRRASLIISAIVSLFTSTYVMRWKDFFPQSELKYLPSFDGRAVCYPSECIGDYLSWRQVDCHINNQYNSCFWKLVASGKTKSEAHQSLKGAQLQKKIEELGIDYNKLPIMFRLGSSVFWDRVDNVLIHKKHGESSESYGKIIVEHCDIIGSSFRLEHPGILDVKLCVSLSLLIKNLFLYFFRGFNF